MKFAPRNEMSMPKEEKEEIWIPVEVVGYEPGNCIVWRTTDGILLTVQYPDSVDVQSACPIGHKNHLSAQPPEIDDSMTEERW
jgi:hypothetical protein